MPAPAVASEAAPALGCNTWRAAASAIRRNATAKDNHKQEFRTLRFRMRLRFSGAAASADGVAEAAGTNAEAEAEREVVPRPRPRTPPPPPLPRGLSSELEAGGELGESVMRESLVCAATILTLSF